MAQLGEVARDDDAGGFFASQVTFNVGAGTNYAIAVDGLADAAVATLFLSWNLNTNVPPGSGKSSSNLRT